MLFSFVHVHAEWLKRNKAPILFNYWEESQLALRGLLSIQPMTSTTPQWCTQARPCFLPSTALWMRKNECGISHRFHINASGSNTNPDTLISIFDVTWEHTKVKPEQLRKMDGVSFLSGDKFMAWRLTLC